MKKSMPAEQFSDSCYVAAAVFLFPLFPLFSFSFRFSFALPFAYALAEAKIQFGFIFA